MVQCKAATRRFKSKQNLQQFLLSCQRNVAQRAPGLVEGEKAGRVLRFRRLTHSSHQDFSAPCLAALCQLTQKSSSGEQGLDRKEFTEPGVLLGREDPQLSGTIGLIQPEAVTQTRHGIPCRAGRGAGHREGTVHSCFSQSCSIRLWKLLPQVSCKSFPALYQVLNCLL